MSLTDLFAIEPPVQQSAYSDEGLSAGELDADERLITHDAGVVQFPGDAAFGGVIGIRIGIGIGTFSARLLKKQG